MATLPLPPPGSPPMGSTSAPEQHGQSPASAPDMTLMSNARAPPASTQSRAPYTSGSRVNDPSLATTLPSAGTPATLASNQPAPTLPADPRRDPKQLLGCRIQPAVYEYEHFPSSARHYAASRHVLNSFGEAMYKSKTDWRTKTFKTARLSEYAPLVTSRFAMCSTADADPEPSIIVECPNKILRRVTKEFSSRHMKRQYAIGVTDGPAFAVYYCGRDELAFNRTWCRSTVSLNGPEQPLSLCGTRMSSAQYPQTPLSAEATVACLLEVKGDLYALGPAHLFTQKDATKSQEQLLAELLQMDDDDDDDVDDSSDCDGNDRDDDYNSTNDITSEQETFNSNAISPSGSSPSPPRTLDNPSIDQGGAEDLSVMYPGPKDLQNDNTDGDWAVTLIKKPEQQLPNLYSAEQLACKQESSKQKASKLRHIVEIASEPSEDDTQPIEEKTVHILTSSSVKQGKLLPTFANISGLSGRGHCNVHVVSIDESDGIVDGDSGSLVVDAQSSVAYGHVVATSPQGYAYVVPLYTTVRQMKAFFETANVRLPEPLHMLSRIALHYVSTKQFNQAEEAIVALIDLVQEICNSHQWERLAHWIRTSKERTALLETWDDKLARVFPDKYENHATKRWLTVTHAFLERFRAEKLSIDEYRFQPHHKPFNDFASAILPQVLGEISAPCTPTSHTRHRIPCGIHLVNPLANFGQDELTSNSAIIIAIIIRLLSILDVTSSSRFTRRSELQRRFRFVRNSTGLQNLAVASSVLDLQTCLTVVCSKASLHCTKITPVNERLEFLEPLVKGGLASVYRATSWYADADGKNQFAVKKFSKSTTTIIQWLNERRILTQLRTFKDPHIVELLDSYCTLDSYALVFPLANGNMNELMERDLPASNVEPMVAWVVKQMQGLAKALQYLHTGDDKNRSYGRHGDINPGNILWYSTNDEEPTLSRTLKIADFGRSEFRSMSARRPSIRKALCEGTPPYCLDYADRQYAAPECEIPTSVCSDRRASDIWSLGCVFLDILVWVVGGSQERTRLHQKLRSDAPGRGTSFWHLQVTTHQLSFSLKPAVKEHLERLSESTKYNATLGATLGLLIYGGVLDPDPHARPTAKQFGEQLSGIETGALQVPGGLDECPVWARHWTYTFGYTSQSRQPWEQYKSAAFISETLFLPYPDMANDEAFNETKTQTVSDQTEDTEDDLLLHDCDGELGYGCNRSLSQKRACPHCTLKARPAALRAHTRAVHRNRQVHECLYCQELFADTKSLQRHQREPGLICARMSVFDGKHIFDREQQILPLLHRADSATSLRGPHVADDGSPGRLGTTVTECPMQMRSGGMTRSYHRDDTGGPYVGQ